MIKTKVVSLTIEEAIGGVTKLDLETYMNDKDWVDLNSFYETKPWNGKVVVIMTEEEYEAEASKNESLRNIVKEQYETIQKLEGENEAIQKDIKDLEEKLAQEAAEIDIHPDGTIVFRTKRVSELEKKVKELEEENKYLKKRLLTRYTVNVDADGAIIYPELKED